jgi:hypothetical protein
VQFLAQNLNASSHNISKIQLKIMYGFCRNIDLGILLSNFSSKNYSSKVYTYMEKVVVIVTQSTTKLSLPFLDFSTILYRFYKFQPTHRGWVESLCTQAPRIFKSSQMCPRFPTLCPDGGGVLTGGEVRLGEANKRAGSAIGLTLDRLVVKVRPGRSPASGSGGAVAARPRELGFRREEGRGSTKCGTDIFHVS